MITITNSLYKNTEKNKYTFLKGKLPEELYALLSNSIFFDIETTGLSARNSMCYLIGVVYLKEDQWFYTQWFADQPADEAEIFNCFFDTLKGYQYLFHFNGDTFDIPFVQTRCRLMDLPYTFPLTENASSSISIDDASALQYDACSTDSTIMSIDLFKRIRKISKFLQLPNCKQKTVEQFLDINREDQYSGGELISVYRKYVISHEESDKELLLLHNHDDITGLIDILPMLAYEFLLKETTVTKAIGATDASPFSADSIHMQQNESRKYESAPEKELIITAEMKYSIPVKITLQKDFYFILISGSTLRMCITYTIDELKYFYPNYKDYYYLPEEDTAVYKSIATYVDKCHRKQAKADTCYTKKAGEFLPQPETIVTPVFKINFKDKQSFFEPNESFLSNQELQAQYITSILNMLVMSPT